MRRPALLVCAALLSTPATAADPRPDLNALRKAYTDHGLPLPPKGAKLVKYDTGWGGTDENGKRVRFFLFAFEVTPATPARGGVLLSGTDLSEPGEFPYERIEPDPAALEGMHGNRAHELVCAIQCQSRGWDNLAAFLYDRSQKEADGPPEKQLRAAAWRYWTGPITQPKVDRTPAYRRLKRLLADDRELATEGNRALVHSLELALLPSEAKPGSVEALIDALVDDTTNTGGMTLRSRYSEAYARIAALGFDAVPTLLDHLDDDRLTRGEMLGFNNFRTWNLRVKDRVGDLIESLAAEELERGDEKKDVGGGWLRRQQGWPIKKSAAERWWAAAQKVGEERYLLSKVLPPKSDDGRVGSLNDHALLVIQHKYPNRIPTFFQTVLDTRPELELWPLAESVAGSKLTDAEKRNLFARAAKHADLRIRYVGLRHLLPLDDKTFTAVLLDTLDHLPKDVTTAYWSCREATFASLAVETNDPRVWPALERAIARSSLGLKLELLHGLEDWTDKRHRPQRLRLLAQHLNDETVRDTRSDKRFDGPGAGFPHDKIEVRNFAARAIARSYDIKIESDEEWSPEAWAKLREQVREKVKQELGDKR